MTGCEIGADTLSESLYCDSPLLIMKLIELTKGYSAKVDDEDYEYLSQFSWCVKEVKNSDRKYAQRTTYEGGRRRKILMHRELKGFPKGQVDHWDCDGLNNQRTNLRDANHRQNMCNRRKLGEGLKGATYVKEMGKWKSRIRGLEGKVLHIAYCDTQEEAHFLYLAMAEVIQGDFARAN